MTTNGLLTLPASVPMLVAQESARAEQARREQAARAERYYRGDQKRMLTVKAGESDDNVRVNVVQIAVDASVDFLWGVDDLEFTIEDGPDAVDPGEQLVNEVWDHNDRMTVLGDLAINGALHGRAVLLVHVPDGVERIQAGRPETFPRLQVIDPACLDATWDQDDMDRVVEYRVTWTILDERSQAARRRKRITMTADTPDSPWTITDEIERRGGRWEPYGPGVTAWPYPDPPIITCKNLPNPNEWWGRPDVDDDLLDQQDSINAVVSNARRVSRLHGHPKVWMSGLGDGEIPGGPDAAIVLPDEDSRIGMLTPPAVIDQHLALYEALRDAFHAQARVPQVVAGRLDNVGQLAGIALQILYGPLVRKVGKKRGTYGRLVDRTNRLLLVLAGMEPRRTGIPWPPVTPVNEAERVQAGEGKVRVGVSKQTVVSELGYDPVEEAARRGEESAAAFDAASRAFDRGRMDEPADMGQAEGGVGG